MLPIFNLFCVLLSAIFLLCLYEFIPFLIPLYTFFHFSGLYRLSSIGIGVPSTTLTSKVLIFGNKNNKSLFKYKLAGNDGEHEENMHLR